MMTDSSGNFLSAAMGQSPRLQHSPQLVMNTMKVGTQLDDSTRFVAGLGIQA